MKCTCLGWNPKLYALLNKFYIKGVGRGSGRGSISFSHRAQTANWHRPQMGTDSPQESSFYVNNVIDQNASLVHPHLFIIEGCNSYVSALCMYVLPFLINLLLKFKHLLNQPFLCSSCDSTLNCASLILPVFSSFVCHLLIGSSF